MSTQKRSQLVNNVVVATAIIIVRVVKIFFIIVFFKMLDIQIYYLIVFIGKGRRLCWKKQVERPILR